MENLKGGTAMNARAIEAQSVEAIHRANAVTGECPYWDAASRMLWWIDIQGQRALGYSPSTGEERAHNLPSLPGLLVGRRKGGLLIGLEDGLHALEPETGLGARLVAVEADEFATRINDGKPDPAGRLWFGTMDKTGRMSPIGSLYRLDLDGTLARVRTEVRIPNAIEFSPDGKTMYVADSATHAVEACDYDPGTGTPGRSRIFARYEAPVMPDGACVDAEGGVWIAAIGAGKIERRLPDGTLDLEVALPVSRPTMPALGGADGRTLFVTSQRRVLSREGIVREPLAGDLLAVRVP
ncbi:MAG: SMP-30/gluconolactonase/LRE family protein, partial [Tagaea sp.]|nr:SMP-30/gluconolactonase/LRE family protein [Tagaea sp.]